MPVAVVADRVLTTFSEGHPAFAGHFPGAPIVPGVLLLDELLHALAADLHRPYTAFLVDSVKFLHPVRPDDIVCWAYTETPAGAIRFTLSVGDREVAAGVLGVRPGT